VLLGEARQRVGGFRAALGEADEERVFRGWWRCSA
jgi:hypothetical protein